MLVWRLLQWEQTEAGRKLPVLLRDKCPETDTSTKISLGNSCCNKWRDGIDKFQGGLIKVK